MSTFSMKRFAWLLGAVALLVLAGFSSAPKPVRADNYNNGYIVTANPTNYRLWITVYDLGKTRHMNYGWVHRGQTVAWNSCCYAAGSYYYVRAEVKKSSEDATNIADTTIQVRPILCKLKTQLGDGAYYGYGRVVLRHSGGNHFYWDRDDITHSSKTGPPECFRNPT